MIARYEYDALNRRTKEFINTDGGDDFEEFRHFYYNNRWQLLETRKAGDENAEPEGLVREGLYIWSLRYIDSPILLEWYNPATPRQMYYTTDANHNVTALVFMGECLTVYTRYVYDPYGKVTIYDDTWSNTRAPISLFDKFLYGGYCYDDATGLYHVRNRYYHPQLGWITRDPIGRLIGVAPGSLEYQLREQLREAIADWVAPARSEGSAEEKLRYIDRILESPSCIGQSDLLNKMAAQLREEAIRVERPSIPDELLAYGNGMSLYEYCSGRPVFGIDPTGCGVLGDLWEAVKAVADTIVNSPYTIAEGLVGIVRVDAGATARELQMKRMIERGPDYNWNTDPDVVRLKDMAGVPLNPTEQATLEKWQKENGICPTK